MTTVSGGGQHSSAQRHEQLTDAQPQVARNLRGYDSRLIAAPRGQAASTSFFLYLIRFTTVISSFSGTCAIFELWIMTNQTSILSQSLSY